MGAWLAVFCHTRGLQGVQLAPHSIHGTPGLLCVPHGRGTGHPPRQGGGRQALAENASFINPSAEKGGRNCHNNSNDRLI